MTMIDIRKVPEEITVIQISDPSNFIMKASHLIKDGNIGAAFNDDASLYDSDNRLHIDSLTHAKNVIAALEKAVELGWFDNPNESETIRNMG